MPEDVSPDPLGESTAAVGVTEGVALAAPPAGNRYVLLEPLGTGGSAVVYTAYDRKLDRKIAIKLLRDEVGPVGQARLLREAQSLARLRHPNVVAVHDMGTYAGQVFIAMELVEGTSLRRWLGERPRDWREVVRVFVEAGRGLAAAHAQGLVHRDFKPDNVLIGRDGSARVADFGLARLFDDSAAGADAAAREPSPLAVELTHSGAVVGTPRYMAPEQHAGGTVDARADQFAFCVALYEALYRQRAFAGATVDELKANVAAGRLARPPRRPRVPGRVFTLLRRGLSSAPEARHPDMGTLLSALARQPAVGRRRLLGGAALAMVASVAALAVTRKGASTADPCAGASDRLAGAWDGRVRAAVRDAFVGTGRPYAEDTFGRVARRLDDYAAEWTAMRTEACEATHVRRDQSDALFDLRMECLDRRRRHLAGLTAVFGQAPDPAVVDRAVFAVGALEDVAGCADREALTAALPPPAPALRPQALALRARIDTARALHLTGKLRVGAPIAASAADEARAMAYPPLQAEALFVLAMYQTSASDRAAARRTAGEALLAASRARDDVTAASISIRLLLLAVDGERPGDARALLPGAKAAVARAGDAPGLRAQLLHAEGVAHRAAGDHAAARRCLEEVVRMLEEAPQLDDTLLARALDELGNTLRDQSEHDGARAALERALGVTVKLVGPDHPSVADRMHSLGVLFDRLGNPEKARGQYENALAIRERVDPEAGPVAITEHNLGGVALLQERYDEARRRFERALAIKEKRMGPENPSVARTLDVLAETLARQERHDEAAATVERALAIWRKAVTGDNIGLAASLATLAFVELRQGALRDALAHADEAVAMTERLLGGEHLVLAQFLAARAEIQVARGRIDLAARDDARALAIRERHAAGLYLSESLTALGERYLALGRAGDALPLLERAIPIQEASGAGPTARARARAALARARSAGGGRR